MSEFTKLIPRTPEERIEDLETALAYAQDEISRLRSEKDALHRIVADQKDLIKALCQHIIDEAEE